MKGKRYATIKLEYLVVVNAFYRVTSNYRLMYEVDTNYKQHKVFWIYPSSCTADRSTQSCIQDRGIFILCASINNYSNIWPHLCCHYIYKFVEEKCKNLYKSVQEGWHLKGNPKIIKKDQMKWRAIKMHIIYQKGRKICLSSSFFVFFNTFPH